LVGILLLCCSIAVVLAVPGVASGETEPGRLPVLRVDIDERTPQAVGADLGAQWKAIFPELEYRLDSLLAHRLRGQAPEYGPLFRDGSPDAVGLSAKHLAELEGLSKALELVGQNQLGDGLLSWDELMLVQHLPDLGAYALGTGFGVYGGRSDIGGPIVGRNLDRLRDDDPRISALDTISVHRGEGGTLVSIGPAGSLGVTTGFNERGLFLSLIPAAGVRQRGKVASRTRVIGFALRDALETQEDIEEAARLLGRERHGSSHSILLADRNAVQVLEQTAGGSAVVRTASSELRPRMMWDEPGQIAVVGCFALAVMPSGCVDSLHLYRWQRLRALADFSPNGHRAAIADVTRIMLDQTNLPSAIYGDRTYQVLVFAPRTGDLYLHSKEPVASGSDEPTMHRYADLLTDPGGVSSGLLSLRMLLWTLISAMLGTTLWIRLRRRSATGGV
jgi:hypothetical protein